MSLFESIKKIKDYRLALSLLKLEENQNRLVWLHDYDSENYRSQKGYTRNGLHWGYHKGIVSSILQDKLNSSEDNMTYARFVGQNQDDDEKRSQNSRFFKVKYSEISKIIEKNIKEELQEAKKNAKDEEKTLKLWKEKVLKTYTAFANRTLRIEKIKSNTLRFIIINPDRFKIRGFGIFLENITKNEISFSKEAWNLLKKCKKLNGLNEMEIFPQPIIAGILSLTTDLNIHDISLHKDALLSLKKFIIIE